jgi:hypothetical protein
MHCKLHLAGRSTEPSETCEALLYLGIFSHESLIVLFGLAFFAIIGYRCSFECGTENIRRVSPQSCTCLKHALTSTTAE